MADLRMEVLDRPVLSVADRAFRWRDVLVGSRVWGGWRPLVDWTITSLRVKDPGGEELVVEVDAATEEFRYERDLLSTDELDSWLGEREIDTEAWLDHIRRSVLMRRENRGSRVSRSRTPSADVASRIWVDGVCRGELARLADTFAGRVAVHGHMTEAEGFRCFKTERTKLMRTVPRAPDSYLGIAVEDDDAERLACAEIAYRRFATAIATTDGIASEVEANRLAWTRVTYGVCRVSGADQASEVALIAGNDGCGLKIAARAAGAAFVEATLYLEEAPIDERDLLVGATPGDLVGPVATADGFALLEVIRRREPNAKEGGVAARAHQALVARAVEREVGHRVTWHHRI